MTAEAFCIHFAINSVQKAWIHLSLDLAWGKVKQAELSSFNRVTNLEERKALNSNPWANIAR